MKAMRGRIALQSTSCDVDCERVFSFAAAFGVDARPPVAFLRHR